MNNPISNGLILMAEKSSLMRYPGRLEYATKPLKELQKKQERR
ncbi:MAG: hypothetical protein WKF66_15170 [Pedobacter sp.]